MTTEIEQVVSRVGEVILGKAPAIRLALTCLLARGHLLIEDHPGVGKTLLAQSLGKALGLQFQRIQFTSDLLPADILGVSVFERRTERFVFHPGPIFAQVVLADEINRATPKAQSALLEAMEERQVTIDSKTRPLPAPFFVIATQNPARHIGAFPLPESQLDRFLMRISLGYPDAESERILLLGEDRRQLLVRLTAAMDPTHLTTLQEAAARVHTAPPLVDYIQALLRHTRESPLYKTGLSPRAGLALLNCARAHALLTGHPGVEIEDVQAVLPGVVGHRLETSAENPDDPVANLLAAVKIPT